MCPLFSHALLLREGTLRPERGQALGQLSQDDAGRSYVGIPASVSRSIPTPSPLHVSLSGLNPVVELQGTNILIFCPFFANFCDRDLHRMQETRPILDVHKMLGEGHRLWSLSPLGCEHQPSHRGLRGWGRVKSVSFPDIRFPPCCVEHDGTFLIGVRCK